jgi:hypothetical protein
MLVTESKLPLERMDLCLLSRQISPTSLPIMVYGFNVLIDKPMITLDEAKHLQRKVKKLALFSASIYLFRLSHGKTSQKWLLKISLKYP